MRDKEAIQEREFSYGRSDFEAIRKRLYQLTGIRLADSKDSMVYSRLVRRIRALKLGGFAQYQNYLEHHPEEDELFINSLTTNLTSFFREPHHFELLAQHLKKNPNTKTIWCAASSTGEEPYSIAMVVAEVFGRFDVPIKIIASDIDSQVLKKAREGIYDESRVKTIDEERLKNFFFRGKGKQQGFVRVVPELQKMIEFRQLNLLDKNWSVKGPLDMIFCRNVMIYFDKSTQIMLLERMVKLLSPQGLYIAGHSENFAAATHLVKSIGNTVYKSNLRESMNV